MTRKRTYASHDDGCAAAHALDLVGGRWSLIVVRELLLGPKRFADLALDIPGISPSSLTTCLRSLRRDGIVEQERLPAPSRVLVYRLTPWGQQLQTVTSALSRWGAQSPQLPRGRMSCDTVALATRAHLHPNPKGARLIGLELSDPFHPERPASRYVISLGPDPELTKSDTAAPATVRTDAETWRALLFGESKLADARASGNLTESGQPGAAELLLAVCRR